MTPQKKAQKSLRKFLTRVRNRSRKISDGKAAASSSRADYVIQISFGPFEYNTLVYCERPRCGMRFTVYRAEVGGVIRCAHCHTSHYVTT